MSTRSPIAELRKFILLRRLGPPPKGASKRTLISLLWDADDNPSFDRFTQLPPELRVRIYELMFQGSHVHGLDEDLYPSHFNYALHSQPAITKTNRLLRKEALPVFYDTADAHVFAPSVHMKLPGSVLLDAPVSVVANFRKIKMHASNLEKHGPAMNGDWKIELAGKGKEAQVEYVPKYDDEVEDAGYRMQVEAEIRQILQKMEAREGTVKLSRADVAELHRVVKTANANLRGWGQWE